MFLEEAHVTFYADIAAMLLTLGVIVLCSRGIITDRYEGRIFRNFLLSIFCLAAFNTVSAVIDEFTIFSEISVTISIIFNSILLIFQTILVIVWVIYLNYRVFRSKDTLIHTVYKRMIPLFGMIPLVVINLFTGILFYYDEEGVYHEAWGIYLYSGILAFYFFISVIQVAIHKKKYHDPRFFDIWSLLIPTVLGFAVSFLGDYYTIALGFALGMTNVYAGIINERSFLDRQTGFFNRFYMRYLRKDLQAGIFEPKSGMIFRLQEPGDMDDFFRVLKPLLDKKNVAIRYKEDTVLVLAEVSDRVAMHMIEEDLMMGLEELKNSAPNRNVYVTMEAAYRKKAETSEAFYEQFLKTAG